MAFKIQSERHQGKNILVLPLVLLVGIFMISMVSAGITFDNQKSIISVGKNQAITIGATEIAYNQLWAKYKPVQIDNWFGLGETLFSGAIIEHTSECSNDCYSIMDVSLANDGALIDDVRFNDTIRSYQIYIKTGEDSKEVNDYEYQCSFTGQHNLIPQNCVNVFVGSHTEIIPTWKPYNLGEIVTAGDYEIKLTGNKNQEKNVDWQIQSQGQWITDWADWGASTLSQGVMAYYRLDEASGLVLDANLSHLFNGTNQGATPYVAGKINTAYTFGAGFVNVTSNDALQPSSISVSAWVYSSDYNQATGIVAKGTINNVWELFNDPAGIVWRGGGTSGTIVSNGRPSDNNWHLLTATQTGTTAKLYIDGVLNQSSSSTSAIGSDTNALNIGNLPVLGVFIGKIDEVGIWNRVLTQGEINQLWNSGAGASYPYATTSVVLNYPLNNAGVSSLVALNSTSINAIGLTNVTLYDNSSGVWASRNFTLKTGVANDTQFINTYADGTYIWNMQWCDSRSCEFAPLNYTFKVDTHAPSIFINSGNGTENYGNYATNHTITYTIIDTNLNNCLLSYNTTNRTIPCTSGVINTTNFALGDSCYCPTTYCIPEWTCPYHPVTFATIYANDTAGNWASQYFNWSYIAFQNSQSFNTTVTSGDSNAFIINFTRDSSVTGVTVLLNYNNTNYTMTTSDSGLTTTYTTSLVASTVPAIINKTFNFIFLLSTPSGDFIINSPSYNQTINSFGIDNCITNTNVLLNMTMIDEESLLGINGTIQALVNIYALGTDIIISTYNKTFSYVTPTPAQVCINSTGSYRLDYTLQHYGNESTYFKKSRTVQNLTITPSSFTQQLTLYNLLIADGYTFSITITGTTLDNLILEVDKQYISSNSFPIVESSMASSNSIAVVHLIPATANYNFIVTYFGRILGVFNNNPLTCQNPSIGQCTFTLNLAQSFPPIPSFGNYLNVSVENRLDNTTHILTTTFVTTNGNVHTVTQLVVKNDGYANTTICNSSLSATSGILSCAIPVQYQNTSFILQVFVDGQLRGSALFTQGQNPSYYGVDILIELFLFSTIVLLMISHPITIVIGAVLGLLLAITLMFIAGGNLASMIVACVYFIGAAVIIIWQIAKKL